MMASKMETPKFTAHNIRLDDGSYTIPERSESVDQSRWFVSARNVLNLVFPSDRQKYRVVDLGCLEGGYSVEFARMGFDTLGIEVRDLNMQCCEYVKKNVDLPNLRFAKDDVMNISNYGEFDAAFCCGLLYHLDRPRAFLEQLAKQTRRLVIVQTHFSIASEEKRTDFVLSPIALNESLKGRWYTEFPEHLPLEQRQGQRWSSFENDSSFWIQREHLIGLIYDLGFNTVFEQFDWLAPNIAEQLENRYASFLRGTFVGIKCPE